MMLSGLEVCLFERMCVSSTISTGALEHATVLIKPAYVTPGPQACFGIPM